MKINEVLVDNEDEWYQDVFICTKCHCQFMTWLPHTSDPSIKYPRNYCPCCGVKFNKESVLNG